MDRFVYQHIMTNHMLVLAENYLPIVWKFQQDNDPNHEAFKKLFFGSDGDVLSWPKESLDLNPIEHL